MTHATAYRAEIDGLRAVAVALVLAYHLDVPGVGGGFAGVDVFFVISGYLIALLLEEERRRTGGVDLAAFFARRAARLVPLLLVVMAACLPFAWALLLPAELKDFGQALAGGASFTANILFWQEAGYFAPAAAGKPLLHLWSLGVEAQLYLLAPMLLLLPRGRGAALALALGGSLLAALWAGRAAPEAGFYLAPFRAWEFLAGAALALARPRPWPGWVGVLGLALIAAAGTGAGGAPWPGAWTVAAVAGAVLTLGAQGAPRRWLAAPAPAWLGRRSYALYLWHWPVIVFARLIWPDAPGWMQGAGALAASLALAALSAPLVEAPGRRLRGAALPAGLAALALPGIALHLAAGAPGRLPGEARAILAAAAVQRPACHDRWTHGAGCTAGAAGVRPRMALIGDSHAQALAQALVPALAARGMAAEVLTRSWCVPVPGFGTRAPGRGPGCAAAMTAAWDRVLADPAIEVVILSAQWANATTGTRDGLPPVAYGDAARAAGNPAAFRRALAAFAPRLAASGTRVVIVGPVPAHTRPVAPWLARAAWTGAAAPGAWPVPGHAARNADVVPALRGFAAATRGTILWPQAVLCRGGACRVAGPGGEALYRDTAHLTRAGADLLVARLLPLVDAGATQGNGGIDDHLSLRQPPDEGGPRGVFHR